MHQIGDAEEGHTQNGDGYQLVECLNDEGKNVLIQLFDDDTTFRVLVAVALTLAAVSPSLSGL